MQAFGAMNLLIMMAVMAKVYTGSQGTGLMIFVIIAELLALGIANIFAYSSMKKSYAQIFFVNNHFSLISVYDISFKEDNQGHVFPLVLANPRISADQNTLSIHFNDQIITLNREDWDDFDLIHNWLVSQV